ncbi:DNA-binding transcriptional regulator, IclR family [Brevibacterium sandarakinum]|uniref:DNA-binding transcriptional regulator, IclR family n=1 Tax=Brevibacterium sandarakinum TaxID=629680 RepID=A0A1H1QE94_BRESA|nr:IclR family transcriptional regulator [Brevibacterium sandarakinum]MDN5587037.1 IclR family transcriptional regulator [Brevibacterium sp.]MDN5634260.1 IclR family transcriptional regulator [Brevibacterium sp.]MDN5658631.1 IclR family transcriptional regulator [Brevibacterium sandarakinum]SDS21643.1 DNA-binding transcriptional regulator, IclR family [Brevibacterium sandarakinum]
MTNGTQSIDRAAEILSLVVKADAPISYTEVVESTELARSTVSRLLSALERNGLVERDGDGLYRGGSLFATYASRFDRVETLVTAADPTLQRLSEETGETVNLAVPSATGVVQVAQVDSTFVLGATNWVDVEVPPHCSALGKIMYAFDIIPVPAGRLERRTQYTLGSRKDLMDNLAEVRERGYAIVHEEFEEGLDALAAPVYGVDGRVVAAVGISGPTMRIADHHETVGKLLVDEAGLLSRSLKRKVTHR